MKEEPPNLQQSVRALHGLRSMRSKRRVGCHGNKKEIEGTPRTLARCTSSHHKYGSSSTRTSGTRLRPAEAKGAFLATLYSSMWSITTSSSSQQG